MSSSTPSWATLSQVYAAFRSRLKDAPDLGLVLDDRLVVDHKARRQTHRGVVVTIPSSENTDLFRDLALARVTDAASVFLAFRLRPQEIQESLMEAMDLEEQIRVWLTARTWHPEWHVAFKSTTRQQRTEWWTSTQIFTLERDALLGG